MTFLPHRLFWSVCTLGLLSACVAPQARIDTGFARADSAVLVAFALKARFSLQFTPADAPVGQAPRHFSGGLEWRHQPEQDEMFFLDPLGQGVARLRRNAEGIVLEQANGGRRTADSADRLLEEALGVALPFDDLLAWIAARPGPGALVERDEQERVRRVRESGWLLAYQYTDDQRLPARLDASLDGMVKLRLVIESWEPLLP
ncbi:MAG: lipoprotein insertase outer membrane protein LolB [Zoogloeaceae bacterium]|jgi:outer membrane lipoprotein LolB|nr:lipoprotein insertase outer membrane protein LolB [Zoogloeaceae bacterium]